MQDLIAYTSRDVNSLRRNLDRIYLRLMQKHHNLIHAFIRVDGNYVTLTQDGKVNLQEFNEALANLNLLFTDYEIECMFAVLDSQGKGYFNYEDFAKMKGDTRLGIAQREGSFSPRAQASRCITASSNRTRMYFGPKRLISSVLPSDANPRFSYGRASLPNDNIQDILQHQFLRDNAVRIGDFRSKAASVAPIRDSKRGTKASVQRAAAIREKYHLNLDNFKGQSKGNKLNHVLPKLTGVRMEETSPNEKSRGNDPLNQSTRL